MKQNITLFPIRPAHECKEKIKNEFSSQPVLHTLEASIRKIFNR